jgi:5-(carboxyamino)imidazole ribonucleotide synthase
LGSIQTKSKGMSPMHSVPVILKRNSALFPPAVIGVFGSGQLGRMLALAARAMGVRIHTFSPEQDSPTGQIADREVCAPYDDLDAVRDFVRRVDVVTFEFENVAAAVAQVAAEEGVPVRPGGHVLHTTQQRLREKSFLARAGLPVTPFAAVATEAELLAAVQQIGAPAVLKTAAFGYDGKGQARIDAPAQALAAWDAIGRQEAILESFVDFEREVSVVAARGVDGAFAHWGVIENVHRNHILDVSVAPAAVEPRIAAKAVELARAVLTQLDVVGVLCVEMFLDRRGRLLINELAPRPHNSGHLTIEASPTSQFEQQARAICGLPLGATELLRPAAMANLLGDLWVQGEPDWAAALAVPGVKLHLYGKKTPRAGRKMGHLTALAGTIEAARAKVMQARAALSEASAS